MAKTRLQAKYEPEEVDPTLPAPVAAGKRKERYNGALDVLAQVYKEKGFAGWYQVRPKVLRWHVRSGADPDFILLGHASANYKGCPVAGFAFRNQGRP